MITKPTLVLDEEKCRRNIEKMAEKAHQSGVIFRPHFKTHQSLRIGRWFRQVGVEKIAVSSLTMAEYFSGEWNDITVAFPVNILEIDTINRLAATIRLNLLLESADSARFLKENLESGTRFFIKIDVGYGRTGIQPRDFKTIDEILNIADSADNLDFMGILTHAGHSYKGRRAADALQIHEESAEQLGTLKARYSNEFPHMIVSVGDTPTCSVANDFSMFDEIRPGNFVFYDLSQQQIGSCTYEDIAVVVACPIVAIHDYRNEMVIYGGGVHLSKERLEDEEHGTIYGRVVQEEDGGWGNPVAGAYVKELSQEHGVVRMPMAAIAKYRIGDCLYVLPVHSCMTANLMDSYQTTNSEVIDRL